MEDMLATSSFYTAPINLMLLNWNNNFLLFVMFYTDEFLQGTYFQRIIVEGGKGDNIQVGPKIVNNRHPFLLRVALFISGGNISISISIQVIHGVPIIRVCLGR